MKTLETSEAIERVMAVLCDPSIPAEEAQRAACFAYGYLCEAVLKLLAKDSPRDVPHVKDLFLHQIDDGVQMAEFAQLFIDANIVPGSAEKQ